MSEDFSGENLRGRSFKGQDLTCVNFSYADIRGADFSSAILREANFSHAIAGLQRRWAIGLVIFSLLLSVVSGWISAVGMAYVEVFLVNNSLSDVFVGVNSLIMMLAVFLNTTIRQGLGTALGFLTAPATVAVLVAGAVAAAETETVTAAEAVAAVAFMTAAAIVTAAVASAVASAVAGGGRGAVIVAATVIVAGGGAGEGAVTVAIAGAVVALSTYVNQRALCGDEKQAFVRRVAVAIAATGGTSFRKADLTDGNFTQATLKNTNFRNAILTRTCWFQAKKLHLAAVGTTYLKDAQIRQLVITREGRGKNFDREDLRRIYLQGANLVNASFIGADVSEANLQNVDLSGAKLMRTQLDKTDLTGACLTGAYIENWGITAETKLDGVKCEYVFMRLPPEGSTDPNPRRKPDDWNKTFEEGEFADFIAPIIKTLDLYHNKQVNLRAVQLAFNQLVENNPEASLSLAAVERRGKNDDSLLVKVKTAEDANHSEVSVEYFDTYNRYKSLPPEALLALLAEKDNTIFMLDKKVDAAIERPSNSVYTNTYQHLGDTMPEAPKYDQRGSNFGNFVDTAQDGSRQQSIQHNYAPEQRQTLADAAAEIQRLLKQLEESNPTATETEKKAFVTAAIAPEHRSRVVRALQAGGEKALEEFLKNPYVNVATAIIKEWQKAE
jgi:uncharacterized protein YjbI with pentapeptide repeats